MMNLTISKAKESIKNIIRSYTLKDENGSYILDEIVCNPVYIEGAPGLGKTQIVSQIADEMGMGFVSYSLTHHTRNTVLGLPMIEKLENGESYTSYTISEILAAVDKEVINGKGEGLLLLDEFPCMSESIMPIMLAFLQTRNIGGRKLPRGWTIVLCGNPTSYNRYAQKMDIAIADRIRKLVVDFSAEDFIGYAKKKGLNKNVLQYIKENPNYLYRVKQSRNGEEDEIVTCRGWENLAKNMDVCKTLGIEISENMIFQFIKSEEIANSFYKYYINQLSGFDYSYIERLLNGKLSFKEINEAKDIKGKAFDYKAELIEQILKNMIMLSKAKTHKEVAHMIDNVFAFIEKADSKFGDMAEIFFNRINSIPAFVKAMGLYDSRYYIELAKKYYGEDA